MPGVRAGDAQRAAGLALLAGVADVVVGLVDLLGALERVRRRAVVRAEAADVHLPHVERGLALGDPLRHHLADAAGAHPPPPCAAPPPPPTPGAKTPAATKKPRTSLSPRQNSLSGVNASGPLMSRVTLTSSMAGTRTFDASAISSKRGQSSSSRRPLKSGGMRSTRCSSSDHGALLRS